MDEKTMELIKGLRMLKTLMPKETRETFEEATAKRVEGVLNTANILGYGGSLVPILAAALVLQVRRLSEDRADFVRLNLKLKDTLNELVVDVEKFHPFEEAADAEPDARA